MRQREMRWFKSSYSGGSGTECVEIAITADGIAVRDSKDPDGPSLFFAPEVWVAFTGELRTGCWG